MCNFASSVKAVRMLLVAHVALGVIVASADDLPQNLVTNPSLEEPVAAEGLPPGWIKLYSNPAGAYRDSIVDGGRTGKKQLRIDFVAGSPEGQFGAIAASRVPLDPKKRYVSRGWVKVAGGKRATADVKLHYYDAGGAFVGQTRIGFASPGSDEWQLVTVTDQSDLFPQARQIGLAVACTGDAQAKYDDLELLAFDKDKLPANFEETYGVTRSPQLALLSRRVGVWETTVKIKPCIWVNSGFETAGVETIHWSLGGQMLEGRSKNSTTGDEEMSLMTYDARDRVYRSWFFGANGNIPRTQTLGKWDPATETMTWENQPQDEFAAVVRMKLIGNDRLRWDGIWKDKEGQVLLDIEGTAHRIQGEPKKTPAVPTKDPVAVEAPYSLEVTRELDGTWLAESLTIDGQAAPEGAVKQTGFKFKESELTFKVDGQLVNAKVTVDTTRKPRQINVFVVKSPGSPAEIMPGIYELAGDQLTLCFYTKPDELEKRPTEFTSPEKSTRMLVVLKKKKAADVPPGSKK